MRGEATPPSAPRGTADGVTVHVIGLTGGIASGKSTVARMLAERGAAVVDADLLARQVVEPGQPALAELVARFGAAILTPDGAARSQAARRDRVRRSGGARATSAGSRTRGSPPRAPRRSRRGPTPGAERRVLRGRAAGREPRARRARRARSSWPRRRRCSSARLMARDGLDRGRGARADRGAGAARRQARRGDLGDRERRRPRRRSSARSTASSPRSRRRFGPIRVPHAARAAGPARRASRAISRDVALVTGFPAFTAKRMIAKLLAAEPDDASSTCSRASKFADEAARCSWPLGAGDARRGARRRRLRHGPRAVEHRVPRAVARADLDPPPRGHLLHGRRRRDGAPRQRRRHAHGARPRARCGAARARRALVDGDGVRRSPGHVLRGGPRGRARSSTTRYERTKYEAEKLVRAAMRQLPITVLRPGIIVGDSRDRRDRQARRAVLPDGADRDERVGPAPAAARPRRRAAPPRADRLRDRGGVARRAQRDVRRQDVPPRRSRRR